jgi:hypothetical protein
MDSIDVPDDAPGLLMWLQGWYTAMCDGDWEHEHGVCIGTLDNPGWSLRVSLTGSDLVGKAFEPIRVQRDEHDWVHAWVDGATFEAACGPTNLSEAIYIFREWTFE